MTTRKLTPEEVLLALRDVFTKRLDYSVETFEKHFHAGATAFDAIAIDDDLHWIVVVHYLGVGSTPGFFDRLTADSTVADLCAMFAERTSVPVVTPAVVLGRPCLPAGAFLAVRDALTGGGADPGVIGPSSRLDVHLRRSPEVFRDGLPLMAPGRLPALRFRLRLHIWLVTLLAWAAGLYAAWVWISPKAVVGVGILLTVALMVCNERQLWLPVVARRWFWSVEYGGLTDFRDLVNAMLGRQLARRPLPV